MGVGFRLQVQNMCGAGAGKNHAGTVGAPCVVHNDCKVKVVKRTTGQFRNIRTTVQSNEIRVDL